MLEVAPRLGQRRTRDVTAIWQQHIRYFTMQTSSQFEPKYPEPPKGYALDLYNGRGSVHDNKLALLGAPPLPSSVKCANLQTSNIHVLSVPTSKSCATPQRPLYIPSLPSKYQTFHQALIAYVAAPIISPTHPFQPLISAALFKSEIMFRWKVSLSSKSCT